MNKRSTILIAGFGSIGRRHFRNLQSLGFRDLAVLRTGKSVLPTAELSDTPVYYHLEAALAEKPLAVIVANPTALHIPVALAAARAGCHLFIEKPLSDRREGLEELGRLISRENLTAQSGFQLRFHPGLQQVRQWLSEGLIGEVVSVDAHYGEFLPGWHPWEDYRESYSARATLGGGVVLTLCHPFDYLEWLLGPVAGVFALTARRSGLGIEVEDTAQILLRFASGVIGHLNLDYVQQPPSHGFRIVGQQGTIEWHYHDGHAGCYEAPKKRWHTFHLPEKFHRNQLYLAEMRAFLEAVFSGGRPESDFRAGTRALELALAVKESAAAGQLVNLDKNPGGPEIPVLSHNSLQPNQG